jgi:hypothetical protein
VLKEVSAIAHVAFMVAVDDLYYCTIANLASKKCCDSRIFMLVLLPTSASASMQAAIETGLPASRAG